MTRQVHPDFNIDDVHRRVLDELANEYGWSALTDEDRIAIQRAWHALDAWPDFPAALARLRRKHVVVSFTILSTSLIIDVSRRNGIDWDAVVSCEVIGSYKPNPEAYSTCAKWLGYRPDEIPDGGLPQFRSFSRAQGRLSLGLRVPAGGMGRRRPSRPDARFVARHRG